jgi:RNA polymerase sigma factor (sigma-70 family)
LGRSYSSSPSRTRRGQELESTADLLARARGGDSSAREELVVRYLAPLSRFAHGRVPPRIRGVMDTDDLVHLTLEKALAKIERFEPRREGSFLAYLRQILLNQIRDEIRKSSHRPQQEGLPEELPDQGCSPLDIAIGTEAQEAYERALSQMSEDQQEAVVLRIELGFTYQQVADAIGSPSANAARMMISRALIRLAEEMKAFRGEQ